MARMGRPRRDPGVAGAVRLQRVPTGWRARCTVRDPAGRLRYVTRVRTSKAAAENAARAAAAQVTPVATPGDVLLTPSSPLYEAVDAWLAERAAAGVREQSLAGYRSVVAHYVAPELGGNPLAACTTPVLDSAIKRLAAEKVSRGRILRIVLVGALGVAVRQGVLPVNAAEQTAPVTVPKKAVEALTAEQCGQLMAFLRARAEQLDTIAARQAACIVELQLATGWRIGEVLGLCADMVDLTADPPTASVSRTVVAGTSKGTVLQDVPKTSSSNRTTPLPTFGVEAIERAVLLGLTPGPHGLIFPGLDGGKVRQPSGVRRLLSEMLTDSPFAGLHTHLLRKSVGTLVASKRDLDRAAEVLGHASTSVTERFYVARSRLTPDVRDVLDEMAR